MKLQEIKVGRRGLKTINEFEEKSEEVSQNQTNLFSKRLETINKHI